MQATLEHFDKGRIITTRQKRDSDASPWNPHAKFPGVFMKHLVTAEDSAGSFSTHMVHVCTGHEIGEHIHQTQTELHEVMLGSGICHMAEDQFAYTPGTCVVVPPGVVHRVVADKEDLYMMVTFVPPLA